MTAVDRTNELLTILIEEVRGLRSDFRDRMAHLELEPLDAMVIALNEAVSAIGNLNSDLMGPDRFSLQDLGEGIGEIEKHLEDR
jgi:hypothetical protein